MTAVTLLGVFGGTFDPVHRAHIETALAAQRAAGLDQVLLLPSAAPPHRDTPSASAGQRLTMLRLAVAHTDDLLIDDRELHREGPSYTVDTLLSLRRENPHAALVLILGQDAAAGLPHWHRAAELAGLCHLLVMRRPSEGARLSLRAETVGWRKAASPDVFAAERAGWCFTATGPQIDLSATQVRSALAAGEPLEGRISAQVLAYIHEHGLYQA